MIYFYKITISIIIGIVSGITEFFPISSTSHMIIISHWLQIENNNIKILEIFIQLGSALGILFFFHKKIIDILNIKINIKYKQTKIFHVFFSIAPTIVLGIVFYKKITALFNLKSIIFSLIIGSFFLILSETFKPKKYNTFDLQDISLFQSIIIGFSQIFCLYPGFSRSGATISAGLLLGLKKSVAIDFSFIISIPLIIGASLFDLIHNIHEIKISDFPVFMIGFITSFIISIIFIKRILNFLNRTSLLFFAIYRFVISALIYFTL